MVQVQEPHVFSTNAIAPLTSKPQHCFGNNEIQMEMIVQSQNKIVAQKIKPALFKKKLYFRQILFQTNNMYVP